MNPDSGPNRFGVASLEEIADLRADSTEVTDLNVVGFRGVTLRDIIGFDKLTQLRIAGMYCTGANPDWADTIEDFTELRHLPSLRHLSIHDCRHFDNSQLELVVKLPLKSLSITSFMPTITRYDALAGLRDLEVLQLNCVEDVSFLQSLGKLRHVYLSDKWADRSLANLDVLNHLRHLESVAVNSMHLRASPVALECDFRFWHGQDTNESDWFKHTLAQTA